MNQYKSSSVLKADAKEQLFDKYGKVISALLVVILFTLLLNLLPSFLIITDSLYGLIIYYLAGFIVSLFAGIFTSGQAYLYLKLSCGQPVNVSDIFHGFRSHPDKALLIQLIFSTITCVCSAPAFILNEIYLNTQNAAWLLAASVTFVIAAAIIIIVSLMLSQSFYLLHDFPDYSSRELLKMSRRIMKGNKGRLFYIQLSFIPLFLLGLLSCCIAFLWIVPYVNATMANFYMDLMKNRQ